MSLFPFIDRNVNQMIQKVYMQSHPREFAWDFERDEFILKDGKFVIVEGNEALKVWIYKVLKTTKGRYKAYSNKYGHELEDLIGKGLPDSLIKSEGKRYIEQALLTNPLIKRIVEFEMNRDGALLMMSCRVITDYGEVMIHV